MFDALFIVSLAASAVRLVREANQTVIPAENWANKELYHQDVMAGIPIEQRMENVRNGKYKLVENYPEPHRDPVSGKIIIENCKLYHEDVSNYGAVQAQKWVKQGKYNLTQEELRKQREERRKKYSYLYK